MKRVSVILLMLLTMAAATRAITYEEIFETVMNMPDMPGHHHESVSAARIFATLGVENARLAVRFHEPSPTLKKSEPAAAEIGKAVGNSRKSSVNEENYGVGNSRTSSIDDENNGIENGRQNAVNENTIYMLMSEIPSSQLIKGYLDDQTLFSIFAEPSDTGVHNILILFDSAIKGDSGALIGQIRDYNLDLLRNAMLIRQPSGTVSIYMNTISF